MARISSYAEKEYKIFLVRPWHSPSASLYPPIMDGVEYINDVIRIMERVLGDEGFEVRVDEKVFTPGLTLRENLHREIFDADLVLCLLDGLRPNVIYELGFAYGWHQFKQKNKSATEDGKEADAPSIVCFAEKNATVLVRNLYPEPLAVPTVDGQRARILNPKLEVCKMFSDNADLLISNYDRLDLSGSLERELRKLVKAFRGAKSKQTIVRDATKSETIDPSDSSLQSQDWWQLYQEGKYVKVVNRLQKPKDFGERKVLALSLMKLGKLYESISIWNLLLEEADDDKSGGILFHLGICYYAVGEYSTAESYFRQALEANDNRAQEYLDRIGRRTQRRGPIYGETGTGTGT
ncbi:tetratricopeptide repeat protein [Bremerella sp. JC817]|uniref:tetratricopeptide repeat protein n=1 Tax=Bremerella sp. JC817 TaxID=3231756 RepID=UPI00345AA8D7